MSTASADLSCQTKCWIVGAGIGLFVAILLMATAGKGFVPSVFLGILTAVMTASLFIWLFCDEVPKLSENVAVGSAATGAAAGATAGADTTSDVASSGDQLEDTTPEAVKAASAAVTETAKVTAETAQEVAEAAADTAVDSALEGASDALGAGVETVVDTAADAAQTAKSTVETAVATASETVSETVAEITEDVTSDPQGGDKTSRDYDGDGIHEGLDEGVRPATLDGPRNGKADNLKEIKGIGPKLEKLCNSMGFYHFDQIASWTADEVAWVNANLAGFKGRVSRDEWVAQARILAAGGETEFSQRVEDGKVY